MKKAILTLVACLPLFAASAQSVKTPTKPDLSLADIDTISEVSISDLYATGFVDAYHAHRTKQLWMLPAVDHSESGRLAVNYVQFKMLYTGQGVRAGAALGAGSFVERLPSSGNPLRFVREAYAGIRLRKNVWLEGGVMPSHMASETPHALYEANPTRSLLADATPYYQTGAKLSYETPSGLTVQAHVFNGWQDVGDANNSTSWGALVQYEAPSTRITARCAVSIGNERPDRLPAGQRRYVDAYVRYMACGAVLEARGGLGEETGRYWNGFTLQGRKELSELFSTGVRIERLRDPGVLYGTAYAVNGASVNLDYKPTDNSALRAECRAFSHRGASISVGLTTTLSVDF